MEGHAGVSQGQVGQEAANECNALWGQAQVCELFDTGAFW